MITPGEESKVNEETEDNVLNPKECRLRQALSSHLRGTRQNAPIPT